MCVFSRPSRPPAIDPVVEAERENQEMEEQAKKEKAKHPQHKNNTTRK